jgi:hypothetical protein
MYKRRRRRASTGAKRCSGGRRRIGPSVCSGVNPPGAACRRAGDAADEAAWTSPAPAGAAWDRQADSVAASRTAEFTGEARGVRRRRGPRPRATIVARVATALQRRRSVCGSDLLAASSKRYDIKRQTIWTCLQGHHVLEDRSAFCYLVVDTKTGASGLPADLTCASPAI